MSNAFGSTASPPVALASNGATIQAAMPMASVAAAQTARTIGTEYCADNGAAGMSIARCR